MTDYPLRKIPDDLWNKVKRRAAREGHTLRWIILKLLACYAEHGLPKEWKA